MKKSVTALSFVLLFTGSVEAQRNRAPEPNPSRGGQITVQSERATSFEGCRVNSMRNGWSAAEAERWCSRPNAGWRSRAR